MGPSCKGPRPWRSQARHQRAFLHSVGSAVTALGKTEVRIDSGMTFWGEWEADGVGHHIASPRGGEPAWYLEPALKLRRSYVGLQNTDPFVFGGPFLYSNCLQPSFPFLRDLAVDDMILFGSHVGGSFALDTVFVIADKHRYDPTRLADLPAVVRRLSFEIATLGPLGAGFVETGCASPTADLTLFIGRTPSNPRADDGAFSFVPAKIVRTDPESFLRPELFPYGKTQGAGVYRECPVSWRSVANSVLNAQLVLGTAFDEPAIASRHSSNDLAGGAAPQC